MDYSKLSDEELKSMYAQKQPQTPDYSSMSDDELKSLYGQKTAQPKPQVATPQVAPEVAPQDDTPVIEAGVKKSVQFDPMYQPVLDNKSLTGQQKADEIAKRGEAQRAGYDKEKNIYNAKQYIGAGAKILSPLVGLATGGLSTIPAIMTAAGAEGALFGTGEALMNNKKGVGFAKDVALNAAGGAVLGGATGALFKNLPKLRGVKNAEMPVIKPQVAQEVMPQVQPNVAVEAGKTSQSFEQSYKPNMTNYGKGTIDDYYNQFAEKIKSGEINKENFQNSLIPNLGGNEDVMIFKDYAPYEYNKNISNKENIRNQIKLSGEKFIDDVLNYNNPQAVKIPVQAGQSKFAQTVKDSELANEDLKNTIGDVGYQAITNKETLTNAQKAIDKGQVEAINQVLTSDKPNAQEITMAQDLVRRLQQQGDVETAVKIVEDTSRKLTKAGQAIQAAKMWQQLTPDGALLSYQRAINANVPEHVKPILDNAKNITKQLEKATTQQEIDQIIRKNFSGAAPTAKGRIIKQIQRARETGTINEEILTKAIKDHYKIKTIGQADIDEINSITSQIANATNDREKEVATALLQRKISEVKPVSIGRKFSTAQAMAQLLNPKTVIRNVAGNSMYGGLENTTQSLIASPLDNVFSKFTGERTVLPNDLKAQFQGAKNGFNQGVQDVRLGIDTASNKYDLPSGRTFRGGVGEKLEKAMNYTLRVPDRAAYQAVYEEALQNQMKARGISQPTDEIIAQAQEEALKRTFQDDSALAKLFQTGKKGLNFGQDFGVGDFVLKYAKTPANILSRGLSYSPIGLAKGIGETVAPFVNPKIPFNQRKAVMDISRGVMGSTIMGAGYGLAQNGDVTGQKSDNARMNANLMAMGERPYAVRIGDKNYSYDWAVPASMPFSAGVNFNNGNDFVGSVASSMDTLTEQPLLQGVKQISGGGFKTIPEGLVDTVAQAPNSFYPSLLRQTAQTIDPYYRETRDNNVFKQALNRGISNTPILSQNLPKKYEVTGQPIKREGGAVQAFLNPANVSSVKDNAGLSEAVRLEKPYQSIGKSVKIGDENKKLTPKEISEYQKLVGTVNDITINDFVNSQEYQNLSDEEKADKIAQIQKDNNKQAKHLLFGTAPLLGKKQRTREQIIQAKLAPYTRAKNLRRRADTVSLMDKIISEE